jgi:sodium transport system permease protein
MRPKFLVVYLKELRETLRDRRSMRLLVLMVVMYPLLIGFIMHRMIDSATKPEREGIELAVIGATNAPTLMAQLRQKNITIEQHGPMTETAITDLLRARKIVAVLRLGDKFTENYQAMRPALIELWYNSAAETGTKQRDVEEVLRAYSANISSARLLAHGVSPAIGMPIQLQRYDTGSSGARSAQYIGTLIGSLFFPVFMICVSAAIDSTAGERERRSLEVLLAQPARAIDLIAGKWLAAATLSIIGVTLELMLAHAVLKWTALEEIGMSWSLTTADMISVCIVTIPLALFAAALEIAVAMNARSLKEAQSMVGLVIILPLLPGLIVPVLDLTTATWMYLVPVLGNLTLMRELAKGQVLGPLPYLLTFFTPLLLAFLAAGFAVWRLRSERYVLSV